MNRLCRTAVLSIAKPTRALVWLAVSAVLQQGLPAKSQVQQDAGAASSAGVTIIAGRTSMPAGAEGRPALPRMSRADMSKMSIELPAKLLLKDASPLSAPVQPDVNQPGFGEPLSYTAGGARPFNASKGGNSDGECVPSGGNKRTRPGLVTWHKDFESARLSARASHKPVMLFQMMGSLDQEFC